MRGVGTERRKSSGPCTREGELFVGGVDRHHSGRGTASNNILSKSAIATADIEPSKTLWKVKPGEESFAYKTAPTAHHPLIGFSVSEKLSFVHVDAPHVIGCLCSIIYGSKQKLIGDTDDACSVPQPDILKAECYANAELSLDPASRERR